MIFLKLTRTAKTFFTRFGWLIAELVFVFLGLYGAFLLERANDDKNDLMRKRQILEALIDEFVEYESDLIGSSDRLDEGFAVSFFGAYGSGEKPFPNPSPFGDGGLSRVNTGIWEAMLQSGGIEVLEVELIQEVQQFFKNHEKVILTYTSFDRRVELMIIPNQDENSSFFYEQEGIVLRNKYKWYVNQLFTIGMSLRELVELAGATKNLLQGELEHTIALQNPQGSQSTKRYSGRKRAQQKQPKPKKPETIELELKEELEVEIEEEAEEQIPEQSTNNLASARTQAVEYLIKQCQGVAGFFEDTKANYDEAHAIPFFNAYSEGTQPIPSSFSDNMMEGINAQPLSKFLASPEIGEVLPPDLLDSLGQLVGKIEETTGLNQHFIELSEAQISSLSDANKTVFYEADATELREEFKWYPNLLYSMGLALDGCNKEALGILEKLAKLEGTTVPEPQIVELENTEESTEPL